MRAKRTPRRLSLFGCKAKCVSLDSGLIGFGDITTVLGRSPYRLSPLWPTGSFYGHRGRIGRSEHDNLQDWQCAILGDRP